MQKIIYWIASFLLGCAVGACLREKEERTDGESVRDTVIDTVRYDMPVARDSAVVRYIKVVVPVKKDTETSKNYAQNSAEIMHGEPCHALAVDSDSVSVVLPVTQKHYMDSAYDAWVSGYMPQLDSIRVYQRTITNTIRMKQPRMSVGVVGGYGFGIISRRFEPFIGIGISYRLYPP